MRLLSCAAAALLVAIPAAADDFTPEPGFALLLNGKDLTGWKTKAKPGESLAGKAEAYKGRFKVSKDGNLVIDPAVKGDVRIETAQEFGKDTTIRFDFLPGPGCNNDLFLLGSKFDINPAQLKMVKVGEWNTMEIATAGGTNVFKINGETARTEKAKAEKSTFEVRAEFGPVEIRRMRVKTGG
ncbi:MAG TPA: hypothetical protein VH092_20440 [Urbifossiella sp.]|jgi:hypothetical protein|nr:hypothetical protein [Urbifossiella sp.]